MLKDKHILIAITGGIAAYKTPELVRQFVKAGALVKVIMSEQAQRFVSPLSLSVVSTHEVVTDFYPSDNPHTWNNHVHLADWADLLIMAPCTLNTLQKCVHGQCDNVLMATYFSFDKQVFICPAMDLEMYRHPATQHNLKQLANFPKHTVLGPETGFLASGKEGKGRMMEPETILTQVQQSLANSEKLQGKHVLITAGATYENIDPVRFIGNYSTGKMGIALAQVALELGATVDLILGPHKVDLPTHGRLNVVHVASATDMLEACEVHYAKADTLIFAAAVADYRPKSFATSKIKKCTTDLTTLELVENPDILKTIANKKLPNQRIYGFALETDNMEENARKKLITKKLDGIVVNTVSQQTGFGTETNQGLFVTQQQTTAVPMSSKYEFAKQLWEKF